MNKKIIITTLGSLFSLSCASTIFPANSLVAGTFSTAEHYPYTSNLLIANQDSQGNWNRINSLPLDGQDSIITGLTCTLTTCLAIANSLNPQQLASSYILISKDKGETWGLSNNILNLPTHGDIIFNSLYCNQASCLIAGSYEYNGLHSFILSSKNAGFSWSFKKLDSNITQPILNLQTDCNAQFCTAAGSDVVNQNSTSPVLFVSTATTWQTITTIQNAPHTLVTPQISGVSCSVDHCNVIAFDLYGNNALPLIITNAAHQPQDWSYVTHIDNFPANTTSLLSAIKCNKSTCLAVGSMTPASASLMPLIVRSTDGGKNWGVINTNINMPSTLTAVDCNGNACAIAGSNLTQPTLLLSKDAGATWVKAKLPISNDYRFIQLASIKYTANKITAVGSYEENQKKLPIIITSNDDGTTWQIATTINGLPPQTVRSILRYSN